MRVRYRKWEWLLRSALEQYRPVKTFVLFSGGNDSTGLLHRVWQTGLADAAVHINTGIGVKQTRDFVRNYCAKYGIPLIEKHPPEKTYIELIRENGFPGPGAHRFMYSWLKERAVRELVREHKTKRTDKIALITGVRISESLRRMGYVEPVKVVGAQLWIAPLADYTKEQLIDYRIENNVDENPVSALLHMSGECLCGAFAKPGELNDLEIFFPETARYIHSLENDVRSNGTASAKKRCVWGQQDPDDKNASRVAGLLCSDCVRQAA